MVKEFAVKQLVHCLKFSEGLTLPIRGFLLVPFPSLIFPGGGATGGGGGGGGGAAGGGGGRGGLSLRFWGVTNGAPVGVVCTQLSTILGALFGVSDKLCLRCLYSFCVHEGQHMLVCLICSGVFVFYKNKFTTILQKV